MDLTQTQTLQTAESCTPTQPESGFFEEDKRVEESLSTATKNMALNYSANLEAPRPVREPTHTYHNPDYQWVDWFDKWVNLKGYTKPRYEFFRLKSSWQASVKIFFGSTCIKAVGQGVSKQAAKLAAATNVAKAIRRLSHLPGKAVPGAKTSVENFTPVLKGTETFTDRHATLLSEDGSEVELSYSTPGELLREVVLGTHLFVSINPIGFVKESDDRIHGKPVQEPSVQSEPTASGLTRALTNLPFDTVETQNTLGETYILDANVPWTTSDEEGQVIARYEFPKTFFTRPTAPKGIASYHNYLHCDIEVTVTAQPSTFHSGWLIPFVLPVQSSRVSADNILPIRSTDPLKTQTLRTTVRNYVHTDLYAHGMTTATLRIPYTHWQSMLYTSQFDEANTTMATFGLVVWNRLRTGSGSSTLPLSISARLCEPHIAVRRPVIVPFTGPTESVRESVQPLPAATAAVAQDSDTATGWQKFKKIAKGIFTGFKTAVGVAAPLIALLDRPENMITDGRNFGTLDGSVRTQALGTVHNQWTAGHSELVSDTEKNALIDLITTYSRLGSLPWTTAEEPGQRIAAISVAPYCCYTTHATGVTTFYDTNLSHFCDDFLYWRGSIDYRLSFASAMGVQQGSIYVTFYPDPVQLKPWASMTDPEKKEEWEQSWNQGGETFDLAGADKLMEFHVPHVYPLDELCIPSKFKRYSYQQDGLWGFEEPLDDGIGKPHQRYRRLGTLAIYIRNPLKIGTDAVANTVDINLEVKAGDDFYFSYPCNNLIVPPGYGNSYVAGYLPNGKDIFQEVNPETVVVDSFATENVRASTKIPSSFEPQDSQRESDGTTAKDAHDDPGEPVMAMESISDPLVPTSFHLNVSHIKNILNRPDRVVTCLGSVNGNVHPEPRFVVGVRPGPRHSKSISPWAYWNGSIRYTLVNTVGNAVPATIFANYVPTEQNLEQNPWLPLAQTTGQNFPYGLGDNQSVFGTFNANDEWTGGVSCRQFGLTPMRTTKVDYTDGNPVTPSDLLLHQSNGILAVGEAYPPAAAGRLHFQIRCYEQVGEDFQVYRKVAIPPQRIFSTQPRDLQRQEAVREMFSGDEDANVLDFSPQKPTFPTNLSDADSPPTQPAGGFSTNVEGEEEELDPERPDGGSDLTAAIGGIAEAIVKAGSSVGGGIGSFLTMLIKFPEKVYTSVCAFFPEAPLQSLLKAFGIDCSKIASAIKLFIEVVKTALVFSHFMAQVRLLLNGNITVSDFLVATAICTMALPSTAWEMLTKVIEGQGSRFSMRESIVGPVVSSIVMKIFEMLAKVAGFDITAHRDGVIKLLSAEIHKYNGREIGRWVCDTLTKLWNWCWHGDKTMPSDDWIEKYMDDIEQFRTWVTQSAANNEFSTQGLLFGDGREANEFRIRYKQASDFYLILDRKLTTTKKYACLRQHVEAFRKISTAIGRVEAQPNRIEPVGIMLSGSPGGGKSLLATKFLPFCVFLEQKKISTGSRLEDYVYVAPTSDKDNYYDNYRPRKQWVVIEELDGVKDDPKLGNLLTMVSSADCTLPLSRLEDKGLNLVAPFICGTTNTSVFGENVTVKHTEALTRRFRHSYYVTVNRTSAHIVDNKLNYVTFCKAFNEAFEKDRTTGKLDNVYQLCDDTWTFAYRPFGQGIATSSRTVKFHELSRDIQREYGEKIEARRTDPTANLDTLDLGAFQLDSQAAGAEEVTRRTIPPARKSWGSNPLNFSVREMGKGGSKKSKKEEENPQPKIQVVGGGSVPANPGAPVSMSVDGHPLPAAPIGNSRPVSEAAGHDMFAREGQSSDADYIEFSNRLAELRNDVNRQAGRCVEFVKIQTELYRAFCSKPREFAGNLATRMPENPLVWWEANRKLVKRLPYAAYLGTDCYLEAIASSGFTTDEVEALIQGLAIRYSADWLETSAYPLTIQEAYDAGVERGQKVARGFKNEPQVPIFRFTENLMKNGGLTLHRTEPNRAGLRFMTENISEDVQAVLKEWEDDVKVNPNVFVYKLIPKSWAKRLEDGEWYTFLNEKSPFTRLAISLGMVTFNVTVIVGFMTLVYHIVRWMFGYICPSVREGYSDKAVRRTVTRARREGGGPDHLPLEKRCVRLFRHQDDDSPVATAIVVDDLHLLANAHCISTLYSRKHETVYYVEQPTADGSPGTLVPMTMRSDSISLVHNGFCDKSYGKYNKMADAVVVRLSSRLANARSASKHFMTRDFFVAEMEGFELEHTLYRKRGVPIPVVVDYAAEDCLVINSTESPELADHSKQRDTINVSYSWVDENRTVPGDCGSPYIYKNKIVGIHFGKGRNGNGLFAPIFASSIEQAMMKFSPAVSVTEEDKERVRIVQFKKEGAVETFDSYKGYATATNSRLTNNVPVNTALKKSPIFDDIPDDGHAPSRKNISVLSTQTQKYCEELDHSPPSLLAREWAVGYFGEVFARFPDVQRGSIPMHEVLNGNEELHLKPVDVTTSAGIWNQVSKGKRQLIDVIPGDDGEPSLLVFSEAANNMPHPMLGRTFMECLNDRVSLGYKGAFPDDSIWLATLKDELLPEAKVESRGAREFQNPPLDYNLVWKRTFGTFESFIKKHPGPLTMSAIGMYAKADWPHFVEGLSDGGTKRQILCEDYSRWDSNMRQWMFRDIERVFHEFNKDHPGTQATGTALLRELQNTKILAASTLHFTEKGNKSGGGGTSVINSIGNALLHLTTYCEMYVARFYKMPTYEQFSRDVSVVTYGDDVVMAVSDEACKWYKPVIHAKLIKMAGCNITAPDKGPIKDEFQDIDDLEFLKQRTGETEEGHIVPVQSLTTAHRIVRWDRKGTENNVSVKKAKINDALDIAHAHGRDVHEDLATTIYQACSVKDRCVLNAGFPWQPHMHWMLELEEIQKKTKGSWWLAHFHSAVTGGRDFSSVPWWEEW